MGIGLAVFTHGGQGGYAMKVVRGRKRNCLERRLEHVCGGQPLGTSGDNIEGLRLDGRFATS